MKYWSTISAKTLVWWWCVTHEHPQGQICPETTWSAALWSYHYPYHGQLPIVKCPQNYEMVSPLKLRFKSRWQGELKFLFLFFELLFLGFLRVFLLHHFHQFGETGQTHHLGQWINEEKRLERNVTEAVPPTLQTLSMSLVQDPRWPSLKQRSLASISAASCWRSLQSWHDRIDVQFPNNWIPIPSPTMK